MDTSSHHPSRRDVLKQAVAAGAGIAAAGSFTPAIAESVTAGRQSGLLPPRPAPATTMRGVPFEKHDVVRIGIVGSGLRGRSVLSELVAIDGVRITAIADVVPAKAERAAKMCTDAGMPMPVLYTSGENGFEQLVQRDDVDFVYTATPWEWHVPVMLAAMAAGKHCGSECPIGTTLRDLWALVDASEQSRRHCLQLENCNYGYNEMLVDRLVHDGVLGDVLHCEAAYLHDLRRILFEDRDEGLWRRAWHTRTDSNHYPTHGLGPVSWYMDINSGDRYETIVAMSTNQRGLSLHREATVPDRTNPKWQEQYITGDMHTAILRTARGRTVLLQHDVVNPRPYSRLNNVQGTRGIFNDYPARIYVEGQAGGERWGPIDPWKQSHEHPLWTRIGEIARNKGGHGGMDFVMAWRLVQCLREGLVPDFDVYDAATWSAPMPLTEMSVAQGSIPLAFPDFTRGAWNSPPVGNRRG